MRRSRYFYASLALTACVLFVITGMAVICESLISSMVSEALKTNHELPLSTIWGIRAVWMLIAVAGLNRLWEIWKYHRRNGNL